MMAKNHIYFRGVNVDQIIIKDLVARGIIGVNDSEREKPQEILINIVLMADLHKAGESDEHYRHGQLPHGSQEGDRPCGSRTAFHG
jgi:hypothetical protein